MVNGQEWTARSCEDSEKIQVGAVVTVVAINGVKLIVKDQLKKEATEAE